MGKKEQQREREDELFEAYNEKLQNNDLPGALDAVDEILKITDIKSFVSSLKVDVLMQMGDSAGALRAAEIGLLYPNPGSQLYKQHAQLLLNQAQDENDLNRALVSIDTSINLYNTASITEDLSTRLQDVDSFKFWFDDKTRTRTELASLRSDIKSLLNTLQLYARVQQIESNLNAEKIRNIELMALFTAIIALIFTNVQFLSQKRGISEILVANAATILAVTWLAYLVNRIVARETIIPRPSWNQIGKGVGILFVLIICTVAAAGSIFILVSLYLWLKSIRFW